jgi:hypothetical protein
MIFSIIIAIVFAFGSLICYASCAVAQPRRQSEEYFALKEAERRNNDEQQS